MKRTAFVMLLVFAAIGFAGLGTWQVKRLSWKEDLIRQTAIKLAADPVPAPAPASWPAIGKADAYTRVTASGTYLTGKNAFVLASTVHGRGFWVMTPLAAETGGTILVNRGFIRADQKTALETPQGQVTVNGLLRLSEPDGSILQKNMPAENRWYSRDVTAIASMLQLAGTAPYFIDEAASAGGATAIPVAGLTVVRFRNHHVQYAAVWFCLFGLSLYGLWRVLKTKAEE